MQEILRQHCCLKIFPRHLIQYTEEGWNKYYQHIVSQRNYYDYYDALQKQESNVSLTWGRYILLHYCHWSLGKRYIHTIYVYNLFTLNVNRSNKQKWFHTKKKKQQIISCRNFDTCRLCRWSSASHKYTSILHSQEQAAGSYWPLTWKQIKQCSFVFKQEATISTGWPASESCRSVHIPCQHHLIYWNNVNIELKEGVDGNWQVINYMEIWSLW